MSTLEMRCKWRILTTQMYDWVHSEKTVLKVQECVRRGIFNSAVEICSREEVGRKICG